MPLQLTAPRRLYLLLGLLAVALLVVPGRSLYYEYLGGKACARCHEIWQPYTDWHTSTHRKVSCADCHGDLLTLQAGFHLANMRRLLAHLRGRVPEQIRLKNRAALTVAERCRKCHQQEYAAWASGPHSATYDEIFLDPTHNRQRLLVDDCLRCHGMHFEGAIRELVTPVNTAGPWKLLDTSLSGRPAITCLTCHQMHREGPPLVRGRLNEHLPGANQEIHRPSLALFDRRSQEFVPVWRLSLPVLRERARLVKISPDPRQALCYQCHAPLASWEVGSGDDRTAVGVHEGLSCRACHEKHGEKTRASCANCHPRLSNCGLDVETMDTTFRSPKSPHNVHSVKCQDCHARGVPRKRPPNRAAHRTTEVSFAAAR